MIKSEYKIVLPIKFSLYCEKLVQSIQAFRTDTKFVLYAIAVVEKGANEADELGKLQLWLKTRDLHAETVVRKGDVAEEIVRFSNDIDASLLYLVKKRRSKHLILPLALYLLLL
jgi:hypothetical protein